jgi:chromosome partitioning protein
MIYAFLNQKGGVGKTTLSLHVAGALARSKKRVLLVDADPQQSAMKWSAIRTGAISFSVIGMAKATLHKEIASLGSDYDHVVIDGPPRVTELARSIILSADVVVIPVQPSPFDVWAAAETADLIKEARVFKENLKAVIAINRKIVNTAIGRDVREALSSLELPILAADISQRVGFAEAVASGQTVLDTDPDGLAAREVISLVRELVKLHEQESELRSASGHAAIAGG